MRRSAHVAQRLRMHSLAAAVGCTHAARAKPPALPQRSYGAPTRSRRQLQGLLTPRGRLAATAGLNTASPGDAAVESQLSWPQRDCGCGTLRAVDVGRRVTLCGWVDRQRNLGGLVFVDVRDHTGIVQAVSAPEGEARAALERVRPEYVVMVSGTVRARSAVNARLPSGEVEVLADEVRILNTVSRSLPFPVGGTEAVSEEVRLRQGSPCVQCCPSLSAAARRYRALDLRRPAMADNLRLRHRVIKSLRRVLEDGHDFLEVWTQPCVSHSRL